MKNTDEGERVDDPRERRDGAEHREGRANDGDAVQVWRCGRSSLVGEAQEEKLITILILSKKNKQQLLNSSTCVLCSNTVTPGSVWRYV